MSTRIFIYPHPKADYCCYYHDDATLSTLAALDIMNHPICRNLILLLILTGYSAYLPGAGEDEWKFEVLHRKTGLPFYGLLISESPNQAVFKCIVRKPGSPTLVFTENFEKSTIRKIDRLPEPERILLAAKLDSLAKERERLANTLRSLDPKSIAGKNPIEYVKLEKAIWPASKKDNAFSYSSQYFTLVTNSRPEMAQLAAIQLEQVYSAYARTLPPRRMNIKPTTILLTNSVKEYQDILKNSAINIKNPAYFDLSKNQIICGSDLDRLSTSQEEISLSHSKELQDLLKRENELKLFYKNKIPPDHTASLLDSRKKIKQADDGNLEMIQKERKRLFERLYHEAFHAYLSCAVVDPREGEIPLWLNEGLAQIFEAAVFEIGELRIGHADKTRLESVKLALNQNTLPSIKDLLTSQPALFLVYHPSEKETSQRMYFASWALAFNLAFKQKVLGKQVLDDYAKALKNGGNPITCFEKLTGKPLQDFEKEHQAYLKGLRLDGISNSGISNGK